MVPLYKPSYCEDAIEILSQGKSVAAVQAHFRIGKSTFYDWQDNNPDFKQAVEIGRSIGQAHLEEEGRKSLWANKEFNNVYYLYTMKSQYRVSEVEPVQPQTNVYINSDKVKNLIDEVSKEHPI